MEKQLSFWDLIRKYRIEIPVIQRDYAQGRDNPKAEDVRKNLIVKIVKTLRENDKLFFDFIYGRIEEKDKFIPFDGQQRLTTLFLLHKYVFARCNDSQDPQSRAHGLLNELKRFSYATRQSSREFCEELVVRNIFPKEGDDTKLSYFIKDQSWFFPDWEKDPTIIGMLVMLDEIHDKMNSFNNFNDIAEKMTSSYGCPITFHFIDMGELELPDDIYVKMNARGKKLTPFENFKANLEEYLVCKNDEESKELLTRMKGAIDRQWLDLFWDVANPDTEQSRNNLPDSLMLSFVNRHFLNVWQRWYDEHKTDDNLQRQYGEINTRINSQKDFPTYPSAESFVSWDIYAEVLNKCEIKKCLEPIFNTLDTLCTDNAFKTVIYSCQPVWDRTNEHKWYLQKWNPFVGFKVTVDKIEKETYPSCVAFYALTRYFAEQNKNGNCDELSNWMRVVWNIIENSRIDEESLYCSALGLIDTLSKYSHNIYDYLANNSILKTNRNDMDSQVIEEVLKAKMINCGWCDEILKKAEELPCLKGKISVLFQHGEETAIEEFCDRRELLKEILNNKDPYFLQKILLSNYSGSAPQKNEAFDLSNTPGAKKKLLTGVLSDCFKKIGNQANIAQSDCPWVRDLSQTTLLETARGKLVSLDGSAVVLWGTNGKTWIAQDNIILGKHRGLLTEIEEITGENGSRVSGVKGTKFVAGKDINFQYNDCWFRWLGAPKDGECDVYLLEGDAQSGELATEKTADENTVKKDAVEFYCFDVKPELDVDSFKVELDKLITRFKEDERKKTQ